MRFDRKLAAFLVTRLFPIVLLPLVFIPLVSHAAGRASVRISAQGGTQEARVEWRDANTVRIDFSGAGSSYFLIRGGKAYLVGQGKALPWSQMMAGHNNAPLMTGLHIVAAKGPSGHKTVAGISGGVYHVTYVDGRGRRHNSTMVLTDNPVAREFTQAWTALGRATGNGHTSAGPLGKRTGMLKVSGQQGASFTVQRLSAKAPPAADFKVPPVMHMPGIPQMSGTGSN